MDTAFLGVHQELLELKRAQADLAAQVQRVQKAVNIDQMEFRIQGQQRDIQLKNAVASPTMAVNAMTRQRATDPLDQLRLEGQQYFHARRASEQADFQKRLAYQRRLSKCRLIKRADKCPCGEHYGLQFVETDTKGNQGILEDNMCPKRWWIIQSRLAFENGERNFGESLPLALYLSAYKFP